MHRHVRPLRQDEVVRAAGTAVTAPARTVVDVARAGAFEQAVVVADAALAPRPDDRPPLADRADLLRMVQEGGRIGRSAAQRVVDFADGGAHSPGESRSRVALWRAGLPAPVLQHEVRSADERRLGYVDFGWPESAAVGEFDGRVEYRGLLRPGQRAEDGCTPRSSARTRSGRRV